MITDHNPVRHRTVLAVHTVQAVLAGLGLSYG
jgi:hypothetical protein